VKVAALHSSWFEAQRFCDEADDPWVSGQVGRENVTDTGQTQAQAL
jgi:hypothetical protein